MTERKEKHSGIGPRFSLNALVGMRNGVTKIVKGMRLSLGRFRAPPAELDGMPPPLEHRVGEVTEVTPDGVEVQVTDIESGKDLGTITVQPDQPIAY